MDLERGTLFLEKSKGGEDSLDLPPVLVAFLRQRRERYPNHVWLFDDGRGNLAYTDPHALTTAFRRHLDKLGFGYQALAARNPRLVYCSLKGFLDGPYQHRAALDEVVQMMGGLAYMTGPAGQPMRAGASVNDMMGGRFGAIGILAALLAQRGT